MGPLQGVRDPEAAWPAVAKGRTGGSMGWGSQVRREAPLSSESHMTDPCPVCGAPGECVHRVLDLEGRAEAEDDKALRASVTASYLWAGARKEAAKGEGDPVRAINVAREIALGQQTDPAVAYYIEELANLEVARATAILTLGDKAADLARTLPTSEQWRTFYENEVAPALEWRAPLAWCDCGMPFLPSSRRQYCSRRCEDRSAPKIHQSDRPAAARQWDRMRSEHLATHASRAWDLSCETCRGLLGEDPDDTGRR